MEVNTVTEQYWRQEDRNTLLNTKDFKDVKKIFHGVFFRMPDNISQVCGPIASGGLGSIEANLKVFDQTIRTLQSEGKIIFDQMPFELLMQEMKNTVTDGVSTILQDFYLPLFESGKIKTLYFIKGWETSYGASWEHDLAKRLGIEIVYLN